MASKIITIPIYQYTDSGANPVNLVRIDPAFIKLDDVDTLYAIFEETPATPAGTPPLNGVTQIDFSFKNQNGEPAVSPFSPGDPINGTSFPDTNLGEVVLLGTIATGSPADTSYIYNLKFNYNNLQFSIDPQIKTNPGGGS